MCLMLNYEAFKNLFTCSLLFNCADNADPPPAYGQEAAQPSLAYADFLPKCISPGDSLQCSQFDDMK